MLEFLKSCNFHENDAIFYQLQFIFNALENKDILFLFKESLLKATKILQLIKVPDFKVLKADIEAKNVSLICQIKKYDEIFYKDEEKNQLISDDYIEDLNRLRKISPSKPINFDQRQLEKTKKIKEIRKQRIEHHPSINLESSESFWNPIDKDYIIDNGVLFNEKEKDNRSQQQWIDNIANCENIIKRNPIEDSNLFYTIPIRNQKSKLFKFFYYNEQLQKWEMNSNIISSFINYNHISNMKVPLVFFSNSYKNDLIDLNSKLILSLYPDLDENDIYVYALCDKSISLLEYNINIQKETAVIKPIFLLLHIPKCKQHLENIKAIVLKIYYFLSIVCDVEIVIFNKEHYNDQINLIQSIHNIKRSYKEASQEKIEMENSIIRKKSSQELILNNESITMSSSFTDYSDDDYNEYDNNESFLDFEINSMNSSLELINFHLFLKKTKQIILIHDELIEGDINEVYDNEFFTNIRGKIKAESCSINYININKAVTYRLFLKSLKEFLLDVKYEYDDIIKNFEIFPITEINSKYINLKSKNEWENELAEIIYERFKQYKDADLGESGDLILISRLSNEITKMNPSIDFIFHQKCNIYLDKIRNDSIKSNDDVFISELSISSKNNINYLKQVINNQSYWPPEKKDFISKSHENFLKNEFFCIIKALYPKKDYALIRNRNYSILENQINADRKVIQKIFFGLENKYQQSQVEATYLSDEMKKGTNYSIRETERVREIKMIAEAGYLQDLIPQDF